MTNDTSLESSCALLLESAKKCKFAKIEFLLAKSSYIVKALDHAILNMQKKFCQILNNLIFNQEKLKMCKFPLTGCLQKFAIFFSQNLCNSFPYGKGFPKS